MNSIAESKTGQKSSRKLLSEKFRTKYKGIRTAAQVSSEKTGSVLSKSGDKYYLGDKVTGLSGGRLTKIMKELEQFVNAEYPELGLRIETNGITRDLAKAADPGGNKARISGSKHGAGLAHDLKYHTTNLSRQNLPLNLLLLTYLCLKCYLKYFWNYL